MQIQTEFLSPSKAILRPTGRMDVESSPSVRQAILDLAGQGITALVVDLSQVDFMDSSGLSALVSGMKTLRKSGGRLSICNANAQIRTALRLTMLDRVFPIYENTAKALEAMDADQESEAPA
jgi:anti-sigma B factor antagonist